MAVTRNVVPILALQDFGSAVEMYPVNTGQTLKPGDLVVLVTGALTKAASAAVTVLGICLGDTTIIGGAGGDIPANGLVGGVRVPVLRARPGQKFTINLDSNGVAANNPALGAQIGIKLEANGNFAGDVTNTTQKILEVISYAGAYDINATPASGSANDASGAVLDPATVINPRVIAEFLYNAAE